MTITEFLLARITDDEARRVTRVREGRLPTPRELDEASRWEAECAAKRAIVDQALETAQQIDGEWGCCHSASDIRRGFRAPDFDGDTTDPLPETCYGPEAAARFLHPLASVYADDPDYDQAWQ